MRKLYVLLVLSLLSIGGWAQTISEQEALDRALQFLNSQTHAGQKKAPAKKSQMKAARLNVDGIYAFNREGGGFVIASADERALPVLGYSDKGAIDWQQMPDNMRAWLTSYSQAINALGDAELGLGEQPTNTDKKAIEPLLKTTWNQRVPYWNLCPTDASQQDRQCLTGCVATAMAQVMNYHQWPKDACTAIPAYDINEEKHPLHMDELPATTFDWDNMLPTYEGGVSYTDAQANAVATLMLYCGQSVQMYYEAGISGTDGGFIADALKLYFDYDSDLYYTNRTFYGVSEWEDLIYNELATNGPVPYCGRTADGGHCFVCDGYDGNGMFHINWGWNGDADGFFSLSILNPEHAGAGVTASKMGFCMNQEAIIGIKPSTGGTPDFLPTLFMLGNMTLDGNTVKLAAHCESIVHPNATYEVAMGTMDGDGKLTPVVKAANPYTIEMRWNIDAEISLENAGLAPGTYHLTPMARCINTGDEVVEGPWHLLTMPERKVQAVVTSDGVNCTMEYLPDVDIEKAYVCNGTSIPDEPNDVMLEIKNKGHEYSGEVVIRMWYIGDKTSQEAFADLPPVSELPNGTKTAAYLKQNSTENLLIPMESIGNQKGNYLILLNEANSEVLLDTATIALNKDYEFEFVDLEVVACKASFKPFVDFDEPGSFSYEVTIKNNDATLDWPKYKKTDELIVFDADVAGFHFDKRDAIIPKGKEESYTDGCLIYQDYDEDEPCIFIVSQSLGDRSTREIFRAEIKPNETFVYPATGISAVTTEQSTGKIYDLQGRQLKGNPTQRGIYIVNGKKVIK